MRFRIEYSSRRSEVWRSYWKAWREGLWRIHLVAFVAIATILTFVNWQPPHPSPAAFIQVAIIALCAVMLMPLYPQLAFKPQKRVLMMDENGIESTIGARTGARTWNEVRSVSRNRDCLIVTIKSGNAFVIPDRAFGTPAERAKFEAFAQEALGRTGV